LAGWVRDWGYLVLTGALVLLTGVYVWLTSHLARAAAQSAASAQRAAESAAQSVAVSAATIEVSFSIGPVLVARSGGPRAGVTAVKLHCGGATVQVHALILERAFEGFGDYDRDFLDLGLAWSAVSLVPTTAPPMESVSIMLPALLHRGDFLDFSLPEALIREYRILNRIEATVVYSYDGSAESSRRMRLEWQYPPPKPLS
jgi:hypothetical protein